jgi:D-lactate dehydrogenase (cytochrome)
MHTDVARDFPDCLKDESRLRGRADSVSFPRSEAELREDLAGAARAGTPVTVQGARTGITGGAVPDGGHVLNLSRMTRVLGLRQEPEGGSFLLAAEPGLTLAALNDAVAAKRFDTGGWPDAALAALRSFQAAGPQFFPPDPTESSASLGGMAACNASGARSFLYGPTRKYVQRLRVALADGSMLELERGRDRAEGRRFSVRTGAGRVLAGRLPSYAMPGAKNAAGYHARDGMDMVDLFVGSEGTLGVISELEIRLLPAPGAVWGVLAFLPSEDAAIGFVERCRAAAAGLAAIEYFDGAALALLRRRKEADPAFAGLPAMPAGAGGAVYVEYEGADEAAVERAVEGMGGNLGECGGSGEDAWMATDGPLRRRLRDFRHAVPETVNMLIDERRREQPDLTKMGTDFAVPDGALRAALRMYREGLAELGAEHVIFGHVGDNHLHVNILPATPGQRRLAKELYARWAAEVVAMGGTVSAEHGIGKLKKDLLRLMYGERGVGEMREVKRVFDPAGRLNPGNLFDP